MHSHTGCICLAFLHRAFSNVSSNGLPEKRQSHIGCICLAFLHCVFSNGSSNGLYEKMHSDIDCIYLRSSGFWHLLCWDQSYRFQFVPSPLPCAQTVASNWVKFIDFWSPIITSVNFHGILSLFWSVSIYPGQSVGWSVSQSHFQISTASVSMNRHRAFPETCDLSDILSENLETKKWRFCLKI